MEPAKSFKMLSVDDVHLKYGYVLALKGVTLDVQEGEIVTLIGSNGAGKSSTLNTISGIYRPYKGIITFKERSIQGWPAHRVARLGIIQVPEGRELFNDMTVMENLEIGTMASQKRAGSATELERIWNLFSILYQRRQQMAGTLSGGEQQMLAIARAMMACPNLLLMDEPSLGLAPMIVEQIFDVILHLREQGLTILLVEQNAWISLQIADRGYVMENGRIVLSGPSRNLLKDEKVKRIYLGGR